ncbi:MAG TPA: hypothetical protein VMU95_41375 [Trebonia sp.]|nr:hypothetical protein [Trebonia sp.]
MREINLVQVAIIETISGLPVRSIGSAIEAVNAAMDPTAWTRTVEEVDADTGIWLVGFTREELDNLTEEGYVEYVRNGYKIEAEMQ